MKTLFLKRRIFSLSPFIVFLIIFLFFITSGFIKTAKVYGGDNDCYYWYCNGSTCKGAWGICGVNSSSCTPGESCTPPTTAPPETPTLPTTPPPGAVDCSTQENGATCGDNITECDCSIGSCTTYYQECQSHICVKVTGTVDGYTCLSGTESQCSGSWVLTRSCTGRCTNKQCFSDCTPWSGVTDCSAWGYWWEFNNVEGVCLRRNCHQECGFCGAAGCAVQCTNWESFGCPPDDTPTCSVTATANPNPIAEGQDQTIISAINFSNTTIDKCKVEAYSLPHTYTQITPSYDYFVNCTGNTGYNDCSSNVTVTSPGICLVGQTNPHNACVGGTCSSVNSCGISDCTACPSAGKCGLEADPISNENYLVCKLDGTGTGANCNTTNDCVCGCSVGQIKPHNTCSGDTCVSVDSCGSSNCLIGSNDCDSVIPCSFTEDLSITPTGRIILLGSTFKASWDTTNCDNCTMSCNTIGCGKNLPDNNAGLTGDEYKITPEKAGSYSYTLTCQSAVNSVSQTLG